MFKFNNQRKIAKYFHSREYFNNLGNEEPTELAVYNATHLLLKCDKLREAYGEPLVISSGCRTYLHNINIYHRVNEKRDKKGLDPIPISLASNHLITDCSAVDFRDPDGSLVDFIMSDLLILSRLDLFMEDPEYTKGWVHLTTTKKSQRVFIPYVLPKPRVYR